MQELRLYWEGTETSVLASIARAHAAGQLVDVRPVAATKPGLVAAAVVLRSPTRPRHDPDTHPDKPRRTPAPPRQRLAARWWVAGGGALVVTVGALAWAIWWVATWVMAHVAEILGGLVALILLAAVVGRAVGGRSGHCSGPNGGH